MTLDCTRIDKQFTPSEQEMKVSLLSKFIVMFHLKKGNIVLTTFSTHVIRLKCIFEFGYKWDYRKCNLSQCGKGKKNGLTVAVPVHSGRRDEVSTEYTVERVARPGLRHQRAVRGALPVGQRATVLRQGMYPGDQVQVTWGQDHI